MTGLKSCPCCGSDSWLKRVSCQESVAFQCKNCGLTSRWGSFDSVVSDLNKRHDPFMPDWSNAPVWAEWHAFDKNGDGYFFDEVPYIDHEYPDDWSGDVMQQGEVCLESGCPEFYRTLRRRPEDKLMQEDPEKVKQLVKGVCRG